MKLFWQCLECGTVNHKPEGAALMYQKGIPVVGNLKCGSCQTAYSPDVVYGGDLDFYVSDEIIATAIRDRANTHFNSDDYTWYYKNIPLNGPASKAIPLHSPANKDIPTKTNSNQKIEKIACNKCGTLILPSTAKKTGGICMACQKGTGNSNKGCYIATACYGDYNAPQVITFRNFRDTYLLKSRIGNRFVKFYYKYSPFIAEKLKNHVLINKIVRKVFLDIIYELLTIRFNRYEK